MNDLFQVSASNPPRLAQLRSMYEVAELAFRTASNVEDETGERIDPMIINDLKSIRRELDREEALELERAKTR